MAEEDKLLSLHEAAEMLSVHKNTVRRWGDKGTLRMVRDSGGRRQFYRSDVVEKIEMLGKAYEEKLERDARLLVKAIASRVRREQSGRVVRRGSRK